jgi:hypothetical protein
VQLGGYRLVLQSMTEVLFPLALIVWCHVSAISPFTQL